jgi:hypothetical protein
VSKQDIKPLWKILANKSMDTTNEVIGVGSKIFHAHVLKFYYINIQYLFYISTVALNPARLCPSCGNCYVASCIFLTC